jgi:four helix bundle protein
MTDMKKHRTLNIEHRTSNADVVTPIVEFRVIDDDGENNLILRDGEVSARKYDLENRLMEFASAIIDLSEKLPSSRAGNHIAGQILRSGTSPFPNHGEAESAESREDFIHKLKLCLKELRETRRWARLIQRKGWAKNETTLLFVLSESEELIRIFASSIKTAQQNLLAEKRRPTKPIQYSSRTPF